jgi:transposase InsO family protein
MSLARVVVTAVLVEGRSKASVARDYGVARSWVYELVRRFEAEGEVAFQPRSRRPKTSPRRTPDAVEDAIVRWRKHLSDAGLDAGAETIAVHLRNEQGTAPAVSTIWRVLTRRGFITAQPRKRPKSSYVRFEADQPNETWQTDFTHIKLRNGRDVEVLNFLDDHSRFLLACHANYVTTGLSVVEVFRATCNEYGLPHSVLSDNGAVFTARFKNGRNAFQTELASLKIIQKNSRPYHPQTCGKVERFHQTLKRWLAKQPKVTSLAALQHQLDTFRTTYNHHRPHRALNRQTPATAYTARPKAHPGTNVLPDYYRLRNDTIDNHGKVTLRHAGTLHHIGVGRRYAGTPIRMLIHETDIRIITTDGELIKELTLNPNTNYQNQ